MAKFSEKIKFEVPGVPKSVKSGNDAGVPDKEDKTEKINYDHAKTELLDRRE